MEAARNGEATLRREARRAWPWRARRQAMLRGDDQAVSAVHDGGAVHLTNAASSRRFMSSAWRNHDDIWPSIVGNAPQSVPMTLAVGGKCISRARRQMA